MERSWIRRYWFPRQELSERLKESLQRNDGITIEGETRIVFEEVDCLLEETVRPETTDWGPNSLFGRKGE